MQRIEKFSPAHDMSLDVLVERYGCTSGIDRYRNAAFTFNCSVSSVSRKKRIETIRALVQATERIDRPGQDSH